MNEYQEGLQRKIDDRRVLRHVSEAAKAARQFSPHKIAEVWWQESLCNEATVPEPVWALLLREVRRIRRIKKCSTALVVEVIRRLRVARKADGSMPC